MEPPTAQVNISVQHAVGSRSAAVNVTVVDELPGGLTLVGEEVSDPTRVQVRIYVGSHTHTHTHTHIHTHTPNTYVCTFTPTHPCLDHIDPY